PVALPAGAVPLDAGTLRVPWLAVEVGRRAVVHDAAVERPAPGPLRIEAHARRVVLLRVGDAVPPLAEVPILGVAAGVDPVPGGRRAIGLEVREGRHLLPGRQVFVVTLLRDLVEFVLLRILVVVSVRIYSLVELSDFLLVDSLI